MPAPFIVEQAESLIKHGIEIEYFTIQGKGFRGYLTNYKKYVDKLKQSKFDLVHAHYGLAALLAVLQRNVPVIITLHGSDVNMKRNRKFSQLAYILSAKTIIVSDSMKKIIRAKHARVIPCGVDLELFKPRKENIKPDFVKTELRKINILFASQFDEPVKNYPLAKKAVNLLNDKDIQLIELKDYNRNQVVSLMNFVNVCILTSFSEGSPQFIKEAMACNRPIVSVDVGDVKNKE